MGQYRLHFRRLFWPRGRPGIASHRGHDFTDGFHSFVGNTWLLRGYRCYPAKPTVLLDEMGEDEDRRPELKV